MQDKLSNPPLKTKMIDDRENISHPWAAWFSDLRNLLLTGALKGPKGDKGDPGGDGTILGSNGTLRFYSDDNGASAKLQRLTAGVWVNVGTIETLL